MMAMNLFDISDNLSALISDEKIRKDFFENAPSSINLEEGLVEFELENRTIRTPINCELTTVARVVQANYFPMFLVVRVVVAVGGIASENCGVVTPKYFTAKLLYNQDCLF